MHKRSYAIIILLTVLTVSVCGCTDFFSIFNGPTKPVATNFDIYVQVLDNSGSPRANAPVYLVAGNPDNKNLNTKHLSNTTDASGWTIFSIAYDIRKNDIIYLGASTDRSKVEADFSGKAFSGSGQIGAWKSIDYSAVINDENAENASASVIIYIDGDTGKLLD